MLKIKDNVDLKELEKFGYDLEEEEGEKWYGKYLSDNEHKIFIDLETREIKEGQFVIIYGFDEVELNKEDINDLIQAGLVEKVER